ncbi:MAG: Crp/Fnr family transcriptional regulator [Pseudomonadota bacterium]
MTAIADSLKWELRRHAFFAALSDDQLEGLLSAARATVFSSRKQIFAQGDESDCLYIILSGRIKISVYSDAGKETVLAFIGENEILGEMGVFDGGARSASATTLDETRAMRLSRQDIVNFLKDNPSVALHIIAALSQRLRETNKHLEDIATLPGAPRLARALLRLSELYGSDQEDGSVRIDIKVSQGNLGAHAGLMRENVNRQMKVWQSEGVIKNEGGVITLLDPEKLKQLGIE